MSEQYTGRTIKLTLAQFRLLDRLINKGLHAPLSRYHSGTIRALERKGCVETHIKENERAWRATHIGRAVHATKFAKLTSNSEQTSNWDPRGEYGYEDYFV